MSAIPITKADRLRADANAYAQAAIVAHRAGRHDTVRELLEKERQAIAEMRRIAPELDLSKERG